MLRNRSGILGIAWSFVVLMTGADAERSRTIDFESDAPGKIATGFASKQGRWGVLQDGSNRVFAQSGKSDDPVFNLALYEKVSLKDLELQVKIRRVGGELDQGGGVVWRAKDAKNYYIARYNPLENNFRVYKVVDGIRTMFLDAKTAGDDAWHTLKVTMVGPKITCYLDGVKHHELSDTTFQEAGMIGLWTKSDANTLFDDLSFKALD